MHIYIYMSHELTVNEQTKCVKGMWLDGGHAHLRVVVVVPSKELVELINKEKKVEEVEIHIYK